MSRPPHPKSFHLVIAAALLGAAGCSEDPGQVDMTDVTSGSENTADDVGNRGLDEESVRDYLGAMKEIGARGEGMDAAGFSFSDEWTEILDDHDLDAKSFMELHVALTRAFGKLMMEEQSAAMAEQQADAYEEMKESMGEAAAQQMRDAQASAVSGAAAMFADVPPENFALVKKMRAELEAAWQGD